MLFYFRVLRILAESLGVFLGTIRTTVAHLLSWVWHSKLMHCRRSHDHPHRTEEHKQNGASWAFSNQYIDVIYDIVSVLPSPSPRFQCKPLHFKWCLWYVLHPYCLASVFHNELGRILVKSRAVGKSSSTDRSIIKSLLCLGNLIAWVWVALFAWRMNESKCLSKMPGD